MYTAVGGECTLKIMFVECKLVKCKKFSLNAVAIQINDDCGCFYFLCTILESNNKVVTYGKGTTQVAYNIIPLEITHHSFTSHSVYEPTTNHNNSPKRNIITTIARGQSLQRPITPYNFIFSAEESTERAELVEKAEDWELREEPGNTIGERVVDVAAPALPALACMRSAKDTPLPRLSTLLPRDPWSKLISEKVNTEPSQLNDELHRSS